MVSVQDVGTATVTAFVELFEGFNTGHTRFEGTHETRRGTATPNGPDVDGLYLRDSSPDANTSTNATRLLGRKRP